MAAFCPCNVHLEFHYVHFGPWCIHRRTLFYMLQMVALRPKH